MAPPQARIGQNPSCNASLHHAVFRMPHLQGEKKATFCYVLVHASCEHTSVSEQSGDEIMAVMNANVSYACGRARRCCRRSVNCPESYPFHISRACESVDERLVSDKCVSTVLTPDTAATVPSPLDARHIAHRWHLPIRICDTQACKYDFVCVRCG